MARQANNYGVQIEYHGQKQREELRKRGRMLPIVCRMGTGERDRQTQTLSSSLLGPLVHGQDIRGPSQQAAKFRLTETVETSSASPASHDTEI